MNALIYHYRVGNLRAMDPEGETHLDVTRTAGARNKCRGCILSIFDEKIADRRNRFLMGGQQPMRAKDSDMDSRQSRNQAQTVSIG